MTNGARPACPLISSSKTEQCQFSSSAHLRRNDVQSSLVVVSLHAHVMRCDSVSSANDSEKTHRKTQKRCKIWPWLSLLLITNRKFGVYMCINLTKISTFMQIAKWFDPSVLSPPFSVTLSPVIWSVVKQHLTGPWRRHHVIVWRIVLSTKHAVCMAATFTRTRFNEASTCRHRTWANTPLTPICRSRQDQVTP